MAEEPLRTTTVTLTRADALAYERLMSRWTTPKGLATAGFVIACTAAALLVPAEWAGPPLSASAVILMAIFGVAGVVLVLLVLAVGQRRRARRRQPRPTELIIGEWPDRLTVSEAGVVRDYRFSELKPRLTKSHLILGTVGGPLLLPRAAFYGVRSLDDLSERIEAARAGGRAEPAKPETSLELALAQALTDAVGEAGGKPGSPPVDRAAPSA